MQTPTSHIQTTDRVFPLLADPDRYVRCPWDLRTMPEARAYWLGLFRSHIGSLADHAAKVMTVQGVAPDEIARRNAIVRRQFGEYLDLIERDPGHNGRLDIADICYRREAALRAAGIDDAYLIAKERENDAAMALLPELLRQLDTTPADERDQRLIEGVFAGNIFDLGATSTAARFKDKSVDFHAVRRQLLPRPWLIDDLDRWFDRLRNHPPHRCAVLFVDNAGCDVLLGMLPLARGLLARGTDVIFTANTTPTLNDVTIDELRGLVSTIASFDSLIASALKTGRLEMVASGNTIPLIDLSRISHELADAVTRRGVDLVILEGMGRAVESNIDAAFSCDAMKVAMVKDQGVADALGGKVYDLVLRFEPITR